jgi:hypothetical protein
MALTYDQTFQTAKDALNKMLERADADQTSYDKISVFLGNLKARPNSNAILSQLANPSSGLNPFIRVLVKEQLGPAWFAVRTEEEINRGGKKKKQPKKTKKNIKKRYATNP